MDILESGFQISVLIFQMNLFHKYFLFLTFSLLLVAASFAQERKCASLEYNNSTAALRANHQSIQRSIGGFAGSGSRISGVADTIINIPVVVHIIHNVSSGLITGDNIADDQILSQIRVLNEDYGRIPGTNGFNTDPKGANVGIQFCLATRDPNGNPTSGIIRVFNSKNSYDYILDDVNLKSLSYWPSDQYLNIWVTRLSGGVLGYAQFPYVPSIQGLSDPSPDNTDGVVIHYQAFGTTGAAKRPFNLGRTATHEIGHWLGLIHIWGDDDCGDDYVSDTPTQEGESSSSDTTCVPKTSYCTGNPVPYMNANYMDYSADKCMHLFTLGQKERILEVFKNNPRRNALKYSPGCCGTGLLVKIPYEEDFEDQDYIQTGWQIENPDNGNEWTTKFPGGFGESSQSIFLKNNGSFDATDSADKDYDILVLPFLDLKNVSNPLLEFDLAYALPTSRKADSVVISYNVGCTDIWIPLKTIDDSELITSGQITDNFIPVSSEWKRIKVDISDLKGVTLLRVRVECYSKGGGTIYLDNVNIIQTSPDLLVSTYPNPAKERFAISVIFEDEQDVTYRLFNNLGQLILETTDFKKESYIKNFESGFLNPGIYYLQVVTKEQKTTKRILIAE